MSFLLVIVLFYFPVLFLIQGTLLILLLTTRRERSEAVPEASVSILIAARNEEENITGCLKCLAQLNWPENKLEVLIGNDASTDRTAVMVREFIRDRPNFRLVDIKDRMGSARGKANVLAHLAREAKGEFFFITDADIRVPPAWIRGILSRKAPQDGTVSGLTMVKGKGWFAAFQEIDWISAFGMITVMAKRGVPVSAVGNNMMITRKAYESTGGYENIPFSLTEDFELFRQTLKKGWGFQNLLNKDVLAFSKPVKSLPALFQQRKRWMTGAVQLPFIMVFVLTTISLFFPFLVLAFVISPALATLLWAIKVCLQWSLTLITARKAGQKPGLEKLLLHECGNLLFSFLQLVYFVLPVEIKWKGRRSKDLFEK